MVGYMIAPIFPCQRKKTFLIKKAIELNTLKTIKPASKKALMEPCPQRNMTHLFLETPLKVYKKVTPQGFNLTGSPSLCVSVAAYCFTTACCVSERNRTLPQLKHLPQAMTVHCMSTPRPISTHCEVSPET